MIDFKGKDRFIEIHDKLNAAGITVFQDSAGWHCSDELTAQVIIDAHDQAPIERAKKWEAIKAERDRRKSLGVAAGGKRFHSDDASRIQQLALVMMGAGIPAGLMWKTLDGSFVAMTQALAGQIFANTAAQDAAVFAAAESHRAAINALSDPVGIAAYDHLTGWPET